jgi:hypothetical protein
VGRKQHRAQLSLFTATDDVKISSQRTLSLRTFLAAESDAVQRAESWLRDQQVAGAVHVLIITGRGKAIGSATGGTPLRDGVHRLLLSLRRRGVVAAMREQTPGSFVVTVAPLTALLEAPRRKRERPIRRAPVSSLRALTPQTRELLRTLASQSLVALGVSETSRYVEREMLRQLATLTIGVADVADDRGRDDNVVVPRDGLATGARATATSPAIPEALASKLSAAPSAREDRLRRAIRRATAEYMER